MQTEGRELSRGGRAARRAWPACRCPRSRPRRRPRREHRRDAARRRSNSRRNSSRRRSPPAPAPRRAAISPTAALEPATQLKFRIGYAPAERFALKEHLGGQGVPVEDMIEAGPAGRRRRHPGALRPLPRPRDVSDHRPARPRHRLRRPRARQGRAGEIPQLAGDAALPQGRTLYNGADARQAAHEGAQVIAVEGYVDVIAMVTAGFPATVAPLGTALTEDQLALLWKMADEPMLLLRRRQRRPARRLSRRRPGAAAARAGQEPPVRAAAGRPGPRRSGALGRPRRDRRRARRRAAARRRAVDARDRGRAVRHAGAPRRAGSAHRRGDGRHRRRVRCANTTARTWRRGCAACSRRRPADAEAGRLPPRIRRAATGAARGRGGRRAAGRKISRR